MVVKISNPDYEVGNFLLLIKLGAKFHVENSLWSAAGERDNLTLEAADGPDSSTQPVNYASGSSNYNLGFDLKINLLNLKLLDL